MLETLKAEELIDPPYLQVQPSGLHGRGLFTSRPFRAGETVGIIAGPLINQAEALRRERDDGNFYIYCLADDLYIDAIDGIGRWVNHSCQPSAQVMTRDARTLWLVAVRDLAADEEITIDYADGQIYDFCRQRNPLCRREECPQGRR